MLIAIDHIRTDGGTQPRSAVDFDVVESYQDAMENGAKFPAVDVFYDGTNYWLADGFHRVQATYQAGRDEIECNIHQGTLQDAQWFSFGANKTNGLYRSNADKQRAVQAALKHPKSAGLSDNQIAKHCGVNHATVANWRAKISPSCEFSKIDSRTVTRNGTTYQQNTANIGKRPVAPSMSSASAIEPAAPSAVTPVLTKEAAEAPSVISAPVRQPEPERLERHEPEKPEQPEEVEEAVRSDIDHGGIHDAATAITVLSSGQVTAHQFAEAIDVDAMRGHLIKARKFLDEVIEFNAEKKRA